MIYGGLHFNRTFFPISSYQWHEKVDAEDCCASTPRSFEVQMVVFVQRVPAHAFALCSLLPFRSPSSHHEVPPCGLAAAFSMVNR
jgi:hypothetical protein